MSLIVGRIRNFVASELPAISSHPLTRIILGILLVLVLDFIFCFGFFEGFDADRVRAYFLVFCFQALLFFFLELCKLVGE